MKITFFFSRTLLSIFFLSGLFACLYVVVIANKGSPAEKETPPKKMCDVKLIPWHVYVDLVNKSFAAYIHLYIQQKRKKRHTRNANGFQRNLAFFVCVCVLFLMERNAETWHLRFLFPKRILFSLAKSSAPPHRLRRHSFIILPQEKCLGAYNILSFCES
jgi:hypothetical protein